jgi:cytochrome c oxidase subunit II
VPRRTLIWIVVAILVLTAVVAIPMTQVHWNGAADSSEAHPIDTLLNVMIVLSSFVFAIVLVMLGYCIWRYRAKPGDESDGDPIHGNTKLEITWTAIPTIIVLFGAVYSAIVLADIEKKKSDALPVDVIGQQYKWSFAYPSGGGQEVHSDVLNVPVDRQLQLTLHSVDVIHSFWVPEWRIKRDVVPAGPGGNDIDNEVLVTPDGLGTFNVVCTELCGYGHATMRALVHVWPQQKFNQWLQNQERVQAKGGGPAFPTVETTTPAATGTATGASG